MDADPDAALLHRALLDRGETVAAAESLTAGLFCATLSTRPSSRPGWPGFPPTCSPTTAR